METNTTTLAEKYSDLYYQQNERFERKLNEYLREQESQWLCAVCPQTGCLFFEKHREYEENSVVFATPFYENQQGIQVDISFFHKGAEAEHVDYTFFIPLESSELMGVFSFESLFKLYVNHLPVIIAFYEAKKSA